MQHFAKALLQVDIGKCGTCRSYIGACSLSGLFRVYRDYCHCLGHPGHTRQSLAESKRQLAEAASTAAEREARHVHRAGMLFRA